MVAPRLIHPIVVTVEPLDRAATRVDTVFREPIQSASRPVAYQIPGQPKWKSDDENNPSQVGSEARADGYVLFRTEDLRAAGLTTIKQGDRISSLGSGANQRTVDLYVVRSEPLGHYTDQGGASLLKAYFRDRTPARQRP